MEITTVDAGRIYRHGDYHLPLPDGGVDRQTRLLALAAYDNSMVAARRHYDEVPEADGARVYALAIAMARRVYEQATKPF